MSEKIDWHMAPGWEPCPLDALCENCQHPMSGHWRKAQEPGYDTWCGSCSCKHWSCRHGGIKAMPV